MTWRALLGFSSIKLEHPFLEAYGFWNNLHEYSRVLTELEDKSTKVVPRCVRCGSPLLYMNLHGLVYFFCPNCGYETVFTGFPSISNWKENT